MSRALSSHLSWLIRGAWELVLASVLSEFRRSSRALHAAHPNFPTTGNAMVSDTFIGI